MDTVSGAVFDLIKGMKTVLGFPRHSITMENWTFLGSNESLPFLSPQHSVNSKKNTRLEKGALACLLLYKGCNTIMTCLDKGDYLWNTHTHTHPSEAIIISSSYGLVKKPFQFLIWYCLAWWAWTSGLFLSLRVYLRKCLSILHATKCSLWGQHAK